MQSELLFDVPEQVDAPPQNFVACPEPGIYHGIDFDTYASWQAVNSGVVKFGLKSPKHFHAAFMGEIKADDTRDRKLGRAIHARLLEPDTFNERFVIAEPCSAVLKSGERKGETCGKSGKYLDKSGLWLCGQHGEIASVDPSDKREVVQADDVRRCEGVVKSLKTLPPEIRASISRPGWSEACVVFEHGGMKLKGRLDRYSKGKDAPLIIDVKKMQVGAGSREECQKAILRYGYHIQMAIYCKGVEATEGVIPQYAWLFVEDNNPFDIQIILADNGAIDPRSDDDLRIGWESVCRAIRMYRDAGDERYGYIRLVEQVRAGALPAWFVREFQEKQSGV